MGKRGRHGIRISMMPPFVGSGPYDRQVSSQAAMPMLGLGTRPLNSSTANPMLTAQQQSHLASHQQQSMVQMNSHASGLPPQLQIQQHQNQQQQQQQQQPPLQINSLGSTFGTNGPVSLHLKRDPCFGHNSMDDSMYDPSKQAHEMSAFYYLPTNSYHFPHLMPGSRSNSGTMAGPSNRGDALGSSGSQLGVPGTSSYSNRTPSGSSMGRNGANDHFIGGGGVVVTSSSANPAINAVNNDFDPIGIAQSLSSAYASAIAEMATQNSNSNISSTSSGSAGITAPAKGSNAAGKSTSHTPLGPDGEFSNMDYATSKKMLDLRRTIRDIISSVWADTECGRSAGMAGVTMAEEEFGQSDDYNRSSGSSDHKTGAASLDASNALDPRGKQHALCGSEHVASNVALSGCGDRLLDDHLISIFLDNVYHQLPIISRSDFYDSYNKGTASPLLVCAMCAAASVFLNRIEDERTKIYDQYSQKVREKFHDACFEPSLEIVQTALIMTLCEYRHGSIHRAWVYLSMGFRLAIAMGYHHLDDKLRAGPVQSTADITRREVCRRAFWGAFLLDRYIAIGGGKALGINDNDISVLLPLREEDWKTSDVAPPPSTLEFFKPISHRLLGTSPEASDTASTTASCERQVDDMCLLSARRQSTDLSMVHGSPAATSSNDSPLVGVYSSNRLGTPASARGWDGRANDASALSSFVKLMAVAGQVAQHINGSKSRTPSNGGANSSDSSGGSEDTVRVPEKPSKSSYALDAALLRWKEELPPSLSYYEAKSSEIDPELSVFISCMHAIYYGVVIMLNRENMGLKKHRVGQLDISTNLAMRSLERCREAAMQIVEISHHICSLPTTMTNALLPWALFQAGTLLIHFMIAGSTPQAQEEARAAILSLDCALRDELSRYWNVSTKYHLVLSTMVKAWEKARQSTPSLTPLQNPNTHSQTQQRQMLQGQLPNSSIFSGSANDVYHGSSAQIPLPLQMQMCMQLPVQSATAQQQMAGAGQQEHPSGPEKRLSTLMKPYDAPNANMLNVSNMRPDSAYPDNATTMQAQQQPASNVLLHEYMFTPNSAQVSINTLNEFFAQLSQEQVRQITEGLQTYSVQSSRGEGSPAAPLANMSNALKSAADSTGFGLGQMAPPTFASQNAMMLTSAALQCMQQPSSGSSNTGGMDMTGNIQNRLQDRRGSIPISSSSDLFTTSGNMPMLSQTQASNQSPAGAANLTTGTSLASEITQVRGDNLVTMDMLDPLLFNPMTPFLQEMQLFNDPSTQQRPSQQHQHGHNQTVATSSANSGLASGTFGSSNMRPQG
ncbi:hypothetical protein IW140_004427 [Coemansia sp. RSA 1813]|nr:hypothetical protein IW140_004427 [Coemansia sp. RSA 1813]